MVKETCLLTGACLLAFGGVVGAQAAGAPAASSPPVSLEEVVVTAQRRTERLHDVPLTITALTSKDLARSGVTDFHDIQLVVPGFTFSGLGTVGQPSIRGVSTSLSTAGSENANALYIDGIYQTSQSLLSMDMPDVSRIEVLKGPQGTLFGRNATGGAIQLFTRDPNFTPTADLTAELGEFTGDGGSRAAPRYNLRGFVSAPIVADKLAASVSASWDHTDGYETNDATGRRDGVIGKQSVRAKLLFTPTNDLRIVVGAYDLQMNLQGDLLGPVWQGLSAAQLFPGSVIATKPWHNAFDPGNEEAKVAQFGYTLRGELATRYGRATELAGYNNNTVINANSISGAQGINSNCTAFFACINYHFVPLDTNYSEELNFASQQMGWFSFVTGFYYFHGQGSTFGIIQKDVIPGGLPVQETTYVKDSYAGYGEATIKPIDPLSVILGLRYSSDTVHDASTVPAVLSKTRTYSAVTPRVSVRYTLSSEVNAYFTYSEGYKSGLTGITNTALNFKPVQPETLDAYEIGVKYASRAVSLNLSGFYYDYKNKQEQIFLGTTTNIENTGPVRIYGLDADASARLNDDFTARVGLEWLPVAEYRDFKGAVGQSTTYSDFTAHCGAPAPGGFYTTGIGLCPGIGSTAAPSFDATGFRLIRAPKLTFSGTLSYQHDFGAGVADASSTVYYSSAIKEEITGVITQGDYATLNAQAGYRLKGAGVRIGVYGRNLTNQVYLQNGLTDSAAFIAADAPPREVGVAVNYSF
jgi:iron complex outermembrane receptor protein